MFETGRAPARTISSRRSAPLAFNGIDRLDPNVGYTKDNCVACCYEVNRAKSNMGYDEFMGLMHDVARTHRLKSSA